MYSTNSLRHHHLNINIILQTPPQHATTRGPWKILSYEDQTEDLAAVRLVDDEGDGLHLLDVVKAQHSDEGIGVSSLALRHLPHNLHKQST